MQFRKPGTEPDGRVTPETIVREAIALLNAEGIDGVSLRRLAARLGIRAPSLYWHFADKSALLAAIVERLFEEGLSEVPPHRCWQDWMRDFGNAMWQAQRRTRDFIHLVTTAQVTDAQFDRNLQRVRNAMAGLDLQEADAMRIQSSVQALVLGWAVVARGPYAGQLAPVLDFERLVRENVDMLIEGEARKLSRGQEES